LRRIIARCYCNIFDSTSHQIHINYQSFVFHIKSFLTFNFAL
jgi:hypothetical protein